MTYTALTRTISNLISGEIGTEYIGTPIIFVIGGVTYFASIESISSLTSIVLLASGSLPQADGAVDNIELIDMSTNYCTQQDLENRIGVLQLAQLTNDAANPVLPDANIVNAAIQCADRDIDAKAGQVYTVPFVAGTNCDAIPSTINDISIILSICYCFLRRFSEVDMPKQWQVAQKDALQRLDDVSDLLLFLDGNPFVQSKEAAMQSSYRKPIDEIMRNF